MESCSGTPSLFKKEFRLRRIVLSVFLDLLLVTYASASEDNSSVWRDLIKRCRVTIETGKVVDATGLRDLGRNVRATQPVTVPGLPNSLIPEYQMTERRWKTHETRFIVTEAEFPPNDGKVRRLCDAELNRQARPIFPAEEEALGAAFMAERACSKQVTTKLGSRSNILYQPRFVWLAITPETVPSCHT